ncbi:MAG: MMPL family transporter, partial [Peptococcaceae bacterium]|nr:MMPL family transporter [Peptococcaceae bacterium]
GYSTTLGKSYNTKDLADLLDDMDTDMALEPELLDILFYDYYTDDTQLSATTASQFLNFIANDVANNATFAEHMDAAMLSQVEDMKRFANANALRKQMSISELAAFLDLNTNDVKQLLLYYYTEHGGADSGTMTLPAFTAFINDDVLTNETYADMIANSADGGTSIAEQMQTLQTFTDTEAMTTPISADDMALLLGIDAAQMQSLYQLYQVSQNGVTLPEADSANAAQPIDPSMYGNIDPSMLGGMDLSMIDPSMYANMTPEQLAMLQGTMGAQQPIQPEVPAEPVLISVQDMIQFLLENEQTQSMLDSETLAQLNTANTLIDASIAGTNYTAEDMAALLGIDTKAVEQLYLLHISEYGDTSQWNMSVQQFVNFILTDVLTSADFADQFTGGQKADLQSAKTLIDAVVSGKAYTPETMNTLMQTLDSSGSFDTNTISLLYLYRDSLLDTDENRTLTLETLASYLANHVVNDPKYSEMIDDAMRTDIQTMYDELQDERKQLVGEHYTLMMIDTTLENESEETSSFIGNLIARCDETLSNEYYLIGNSVMNYEMEQSFNRELLTITLLTAISVFSVVAITFRSIAIPAILVAIVQCGVYVTVTAN